MPLLAAAALYVGLTFAAGMVLGAIRVPLLVPLLGESAAILVEAPFILAACWLAAGWVLRRHAAAPAPLGLMALLLLLVLEIGLGWLLRGQSPMAWLRRLGTPAGALSLALYLLFAVMPLAVSARRRRNSAPAADRR